MWPSSKENSVLWSSVCAISSKLLIKRASVYKFDHRNPNLRLDIKSQKAISLLITLTLSLNTHIENSVVVPIWKQQFLRLFQKNLNYTPLNLFLTLTIAKLIISTRTDVTLQTSLKYLRAILMCSAFTRDYGYDKSTNILIGDVNCPKIMCSGELRLHKKTFQSLGRRKYQCAQCVSVCPVRNNTFEYQKKFLFLDVWPRGLYFRKESKINSRCYRRCVLSWQVFFHEREMGILWRLCNILEIHLWLWKVWFLIVCSQSSFFVTKAACKDDKKVKTRFFFAKKRWTCYPAKNCSLVSHFNQLNVKRKNCVWATKYKRLLEMCIVQIVEMKSVFRFQPI